MPTESELRLHRCCFTGHRPHKLNKPEALVIDALERCIRQAIVDAPVPDPPEQATVPHQTAGSAGSVR